MTNQRLWKIGTRFIHKAYPDCHYLVVNSGTGDIPYLLNLTSNTICGGSLTPKYHMNDEWLDGLIEADEKWQPLVPKFSFGQLVGGFAPSGYYRVKNKENGNVGNDIFLVGKWGFKTLVFWKYNAETAWELADECWDDTDYEFWQYANLSKSAEHIRCRLRLK